MKGHYFLFLVSFSLVMLFVACDNDDNNIQETCNDGILNQGETLIDCGGPCPPCIPTCNNGIQDIDPGSNWVEEGVDCGESDDLLVGHSHADQLIAVVARQEQRVRPLAQQERTELVR